MIKNNDTIISECKFYNKMILKISNIYKIIEKNAILGYTGKIKNYIKE